MQTNTFRTLLKRFRDDTSGVISLEFVIMMPILFWTFMAVYVFFDGYRQSALNLKAAYTISDLISRETEAINDPYVNSMMNVLRLMTRSGSEVDLRISVIRWDQDDDRYYVYWSANRGFAAELTDDNVIDFAERLPVMPDDEMVILVETKNVFEPVFDVGMNDIDLDNFVFTRPRFASKVEWDAGETDTETNVQDDPA
ncbi:TadE/TadG family type IV pilus assembly protein [Albibacillus kandeliae]|uniref:TadE/TadG family type IV pilus assembly protein n=1 Tax=Albibacillus kandeliae TaxID=2174228 RepID=UPI000D6954D8|nr:hypothetical protein [Albibacillus kandeliae]